MSTFIWLASSYQFWGSNSNRKDSNQCLMVSGWRFASDLPPKKTSSGGRNQPPKPTTYLVQACLNLTKVVGELVLLRTNTSFFGNQNHPRMWVCPRKLKAILWHPRRGICHDTNFKQKRKLQQFPKKPPWSLLSLKKTSSLRGVFY